VDPSPGDPDLTCANAQLLPWGSCLAARRSSRDTFAFGSIDPLTFIPCACLAIPMLPQLEPIACDGAKIFPIIEITRAKIIPP